jgi:hypothetical protein
MSGTLGPSEYCVGLGPVDPRVKNNPFRPVLCRYFAPQDQTPAAATL